MFMHGRIKQAHGISTPVGGPQMRVGAADHQCSSPSTLSAHNTGIGLRLAILRSTGSRAAGRSRRPSPRLIGGSGDGAFVCVAYIEAARGYSYMQCFVCVGLYIIS